MVQRRDFTQSVPLPKNTEFNAEVIPITPNYTPGRLNISQGILEKDITLQATPATTSRCVITTTQYKFQDIIISVYNSTGTQITYIYTNPVSLSLSSGIKFSVKLSAHEGYIKSELINIIEEQIYTLSRNMNISAISDATPVNCEIVIEPTTHQYISITTDSGLVIDSDIEDEVRQVVPYWTRYTGEITTDPGYSPGVLNISGEVTLSKNSFNFTKYHPEDPTDESGYATVKASPATEYTHRLTIYKYEHQKLKIRAYFNESYIEFTVDTPNPIESTSSYNVYGIPDTSTITISIEPEPGYQSLYPILRYIEDSQPITIDVLDSSQQFMVDKDFDVYAYSEASISYHSISLIQSQDQTMYLSSGEYEDITGTVYLKHNSIFTIRAVAHNPTYYLPGEVISSDLELIEIEPHVYQGTVENDNMIYITPVILKQQ